MPQRTKGKQAWQTALEKVESKGVFFGNGAGTQEGLSSISEMFWTTFCKEAKDECPSERPAATSVADFGLRLSDTGLGYRLEAQQQASAVAGLTAAAAMKLLMTPEHLRGQTEGYVAALAEKAGMNSRPMNPTAATGGRGTMYSHPDSKDVMLFVEAGDPASTSKDKVHEGPYVKYQVQGAGKNGAFRVPMAGNPFPTLGGEVPTSTAGRMVDFLSKTRRRG